MLDALPAPNSFKNLRDFVRPIFRRQQGNILAEHFFAAIAVNSFRPFVPAGDGAIESLADDGIFGGIDD
jgi:hypothetical protein